MSKKFSLLLIALLGFGVLLPACQAKAVEVIKEIEVTRVVTETIVQEGEQVEATRGGPEVQEVVVTPAVGEMPVEHEPVTLYWNLHSEPPTMDSSLATDSPPCGV